MMNKIFIAVAGALIAITVVLGLQLKRAYTENGELKQNLEKVSTELFNSEVQKKNLILEAARRDDIVLKSHQASQKIKSETEKLKFKLRKINANNNTCLNTTVPVDVINILRH